MNPFSDPCGMPFLGGSMPSIQQLIEQLHRTQLQLAEERSQADKYAKDVKSYRSELRKAIADIEMLDHDRARLKDANKGHERELAIVRRELQDAKTLANDRVKELVGTRTFLSKADGLSLSDIREKVTTLNEEIFQGAALLGETLVRRSHGASEDEMAFAAATAQDVVGRRICDTLISESYQEEREVNPLFVQIALQVFLATYCKSIIQSWFPGDSSSAKVLHSIYKKIHEKEDQAAAGRWRAFTRKYSRPPIDDWKKDFLHKLNCVLRIARWDISHNQKDEEFEKRFTPIFNAVQNVRNAIGEEFTSADLAVFVVDEDLLFDRGYMEDAYEDPAVAKSGGSSGVVVGTTAIGMKTALKEKNDQGGRLYECLLPAKVVLESALQEALAPRHHDGRG